MSGVALVDASGRMTIDAPRSADDRTLFAAGATSIVYDTRTGHRDGVYVDDTTPDQRAVCVKLAAGGVTVFAGIASGSGHPFDLPGVVNMIEVYPFGSGCPLWAWIPLPKPKHGRFGYIVQHRFAFPGHKPPSASGRRLLERYAACRRPDFLWRY